MKNKEAETKAESISNEAKPVNQAKKFVFILLAIVIFITALALVIINKLQVEPPKNSSKEVVEQIENKEAPQVLIPPPPSAMEERKDTLSINNNIEEPNSTDERLMQNIDSYRLYLFNANKLLVNFFQDKAFTEQWGAIKMVGLPNEIEAMLAMLDEYNTNYLLHSDLGKQQILLNNWLLDKFIKIEKLPDDYKNKELLRVKIIENMENLINFLYSKELQHIFMSKISK